MGNFTSGSLAQKPTYKRKVTLMLNCFIVLPLGTWCFKTFSGFCCLDCLFHWLWSNISHVQRCSSYHFDLPNIPPFILSWCKNLFTCLVADEPILFSYLCEFILYNFLYNFSIALKKKETNFHDYVNNNKSVFFSFLDLS